MWINTVHKTKHLRKSYKSVMLFNNIEMPIIGYFKDFFKTD